MIEFDKYQDSIAGMESEHDNGKEDRRWSYKCCAAQVYPLNFELYNKKYSILPVLEILTIINVVTSTTSVKKVFQKFQ